jgi:hypothetical protein
VTAGHPQLALQGDAVEAHPLGDIACVCALQAETVCDVAQHNLKMGFALPASIKRVSDKTNFLDTF